LAWLSQHFVPICLSKPSSGRNPQTTLKLEQLDQF